MDLFFHLFGKEDNLSSLQMVIRALLVFMAALVIVRIGSVRTFGKESVMDNIVVIILGGMLSRVITGASPFLPVMAATLAIILFHRLLAYICLHNQVIGSIIKGRKRILFSEGELNTQNMQKSVLSEEDLRQGLRQAINDDQFEKVKEVFIERNGTITAVKQ